MRSEGEGRERGGQGGRGRQRRKERGREGGEGGRAVARYEKHYYEDQHPLIKSFWSGRKTLYSAIPSDN